MMKNKPSIIIDGGEQQGKSYLSKKLAETYDLPIVHYGPPSDTFDFLDDYFKPIYHNPKGVIIDRNYMSGLCYGKLFNRDDFPEGRVEAIEKRFNAINTILVILDIPEKKWLSRDELIDNEQNQLVKQYFKDAYKQSNIINKFYINPLNENEVRKVMDRYESIKETRI